MHWWELLGYSTAMNLMGYKVWFFLDSVIHSLLPLLSLLFCDVCYGDNRNISFYCAKLCDLKCVNVMLLLISNYNIIYLVTRYPLSRSWYRSFLSPEPGKASRVLCRYCKSVSGSDASWGAFLPISYCMSTLAFSGPAPPPQPTFPETTWEVQWYWQ